jgi:thioredoxin 1
MSEYVTELSDDTFEQEVLQADMPVLVDFWAEWCMPCKMIAPTLEQLAQEYDGRVKVAKVDTDSCRQTAIKYGISAIPTLILFKDGAMARKFVGLQSKQDLRSAIDDVLE